MIILDASFSSVVFSNKFMVISLFSVFQSKKHAFSANAPKIGTAYRMYFVKHYFNLAEETLMHEVNTLENGNYDPRRKRLVLNATAKSYGKTKHNFRMFQSSFSNRADKLRSGGFSERN